MQHGGESIDGHGVKVDSFTDSEMDCDKAMELLYEQDDVDINLDGYRNNDLMHDEQSD